MRFKTELVDRQLRYDGISIVAPEALSRHLSLAIPSQKLAVTGVSEDVSLFNENVPPEEAILLETELPPVTIDLGWQLPAPYDTLNLEDYIVSKAGDYILTLPAADHTRAAGRVAQELNEIVKRDMVDFMRTVIYILDTFRTEDIVWGVGRGSSCASYILFILGLHSVDCLKYNVPMSEFYHD